MKEGNLSNTIQEQVVLLRDDHRLLFVFACFKRIAGIGWFRSKLIYQRKFIKEVSGEDKHGK